MTREDEAQASLSELADIRNWWTDERRDSAREEALSDFRRRVWWRNFLNLPAKTSAGC